MSGPSSPRLSRCALDPASPTRRLGTEPRAPRVAGKKALGVSRPVTISNRPSLPVRDRRRGETGECPVTKTPMTLEDLLPVKSSTTVKPRTTAAASIPGLLSIFHNEWDAPLETHELRVDLHGTRQNSRTRCTSTTPRAASSPGSRRSATRRARPSRTRARLVPPPPPASEGRHPKTHGS